MPVRALRYLTILILTGRDPSFALDLWLMTAKFENFQRCSVSHFSRERFSVSFFKIFTVTLKEGVSVVHVTSLLTTCGLPKHFRMVIPQQSERNNSATL